MNTDTGISEHLITCKGLPWGTARLSAQLGEDQVSRSIHSTFHTTDGVEVNLCNVSDIEGADVSD